MYHFDKTTGMCLAFKFNGCGGNENRFESKSDCQRTCIPMDYGSCALFKEPLKNEQGQTVLCGREDGHRNFEKCPVGYSCKYFAFFGNCCEDKNEQLFDKNLTPKCAIGKPKTVPHGGYNSLLVGKTCEDDFCPIDHKCHQLEIFAHCCPK
uniref:BPTI/Kunitz inhibitor domain-containing protein n=1 Tax=Panagrellus redivivus TaxID=6233 RepID=A0A7E4ZU47_PANRE